MITKEEKRRSGYVTSFRIRNDVCAIIFVMETLRSRLASELRRRRGNQSYGQFAKELGISKTTLYRIELEQQNTGLDLIEHICRRLRCTVCDLLCSRNK